MHGDGIVEAKLALLAQLHDGGRSKELAVRRHAEARLRRHRRLRGRVGGSEALRPHQFLVRHDAHGEAGQAALENLSFDPGGEQPLGRLHIGVRIEARRRRRLSKRPCCGDRQHQHDRQDDRERSERDVMHGHGGLVR
jgi:hypothetical protein